MNEPSGWDIGFTKRKLAEALTARMNWGRGGCGTPLIENNPLTNDQMAELLDVLDEVERLKGALNESRSRCFYCGENPCRCDEMAAVADGVKSEGVKVTD